MLGFSTFSEFPFATVAKDNNVTITATKNELTISIGNPGISADAIVEIPNPNPLTLGFGDLTITGDSNVTGVKNELSLGTGTVTVSADANVTPAATPLTLATGTAQAITWSEIIPGATMVWTPIDPT